MQDQRVDPYLIALLAILSGFVAYKIRFLGLPLYWDEAWVYAPAVKALHTNGLSLLPGALDATLSRGHPLLFHFIGGSWVALFGASRTSLHLFALIISLALLVVTYWSGLRVGSKVVGLGAVLLTIANEAFLAQSGILLPEIMLALFALLTTMFYVLRKPLPFVLAAFCALMTKESALVLIACICMWELLRIITSPRDASGKAEWRWLAITLAPILLGSLFFVFQRMRSGWFFYPEHLGFLTWDLKDIIYKIKFCYSTVLENQGLEWLTYSFGLIAPFAWFGKDWRRSVPVVFLYIAAIKVLFGRWTLPLVPTLLLPLLCFALIFWLQFLRYFRLERSRGEFASVGIMFTVAFMGFSSINFLTDRYLICLVPFIALGTLVLMDSAFKQLSAWVLPLVVLVVAGIMFSQIGKDGKVGDTKMSYVDAIHAQQELIHYCEEHGLQNDVIFGTFMDKVYMTDPEAGYLSSPRTFTNVVEHFDERATYALYNSSSSGEAYGQRTELGFVLLKRFEFGSAWSEIYRTRVVP